MKQVLVWAIIIQVMWFDKMLVFAEGSMERKFIHENFKYVRVVPVSNGICWNCDRLSRQIVTNYRALDYYGDVFVWLDREGRAQSSEEIKGEIRAALIEAGADPQRLYILVNDRMTENVILADESAIRSEFDKPDYTYEFEGLGGKTKLRALYAENGENYKEMVQGSKLLKKIRLTNSALSSPSVSSFLQECSLDCWWF